MSELVEGDEIHIRDVWEHNLEQEFSLIRDIVDDYPIVGMDTEFPGVVLKHLGNSKTANQFHYLSLKDNVDILKLIQLGLTFSDRHGNLPTCGGDRPCVWQFNFREFNITNDIFATDSIELLRDSGIDFNKHNEMGIGCNQFAQLFMSSGVVLNSEVQWITFHSAYDFGYLLKLLIGRYLPATVVGFFDLINLYFPVIYDIKHLMKYHNSLYGGLAKVAEIAGVKRYGICHQAGSDSLLTLHTFNKLKADYFNGSVEKYEGVLFGLETDSEI